MRLPATAYIVHWRETDGETGKTDFGVVRKAFTDVEAARAKVSALADEFQRNSLEKPIKLATRDGLDVEIRDGLRTLAITAETADID